jgi:hypothetical protein
MGAGRCLSVCHPPWHWVGRCVMCAGRSLPSPAPPSPVPPPSLDPPPPASDPKWEAVVLAMGADAVVTVEHNRLTFDHPGLSTMTAAAFRGNLGQLVATFDAALSLSSLCVRGLPPPPPHPHPTPTPHPAPARHPQ